MHPCIPIYSKKLLGVLTAGERPTRLPTQGSNTHEGTETGTDVTTELLPSDGNLPQGCYSPGCRRDLPSRGRPGLALPAPRALCRRSLRGSCCQSSHLFSRRSGDQQQLRRATDLSWKESPVCDQPLSENALNTDSERNGTSWPARGKPRLLAASKARGAVRGNGNSHTGSPTAAQTCLEPKQDRNNSNNNATPQPHNRVFILHTTKRAPASRRTLKARTRCTDTGPQLHLLGLRLHYRFPTQYQDRDLVMCSGCTLPHLSLLKF